MDIIFDTKGFGEKIFMAVDQGRFQRIQKATKISDSGIFGMIKIL